MRKALLLTALMVALCASIQAQTYRFGLQASPSFTWLKTDNNIINSNGTNTGLRLTVLAEYYFKENFAVVTGIGFHFNAGGQLKYDLAGNYWPDVDYVGTVIDVTKQAPYPVFAPGTNLRYKARYLEIPLGLKMRTSEFGPMRAFLEAPLFHFGFRGRSAGDISGSVSEDGLDIRQQVGGLNLSWGLGAGIEYNISDESAVVAGIFYNQGFTDFTKDSGYLISGVNDNGTPADPLDDTFTSISEDSKAVLNNIMVRIAFMF
jgi:Outer membrane protein beta-barrel domain